ncbi:hypothetical protein V2J09_012745 [Rumex salicifolius]
MEDYNGPNSPDYSQMVMAAIEALGEKEGSNESAISNYIESNNSDLPADHSTLLSDALEKMKESGQLVFANDNYLKPDLEAPPKRGRGRPRKNKAAPPPAPVTGPTRSRGRPPKVKDPLAPAPEPKKAAPVGRPRGRQPKKTEPAPPVETTATVGVKRGRGRPPKVRPAATPPAATVGA